MDKKLLTILLIAAFLMTSIGFVSASDDGQEINVKIAWDDTGSSDRPSEVIVNLIHDGKIVETTKLSKSNSWSSVFKNQDIDGSYSIQVSGIANYDVKKSGNANDGFVITAKMKTDVLGVNEDESTVEQTDVNETPVSKETNADNIITENITEETNSSDNQTDNSTDDSNSTDDQTDNSTDDSNSTDDQTEETTEETTTTTTTTEVISTVVKETAVKKPVQKQPVKHTLRNTGLPIALVLAAIAAIFMPIVYNKK